MDATNNIATDLFYKIRSRFSGLKLGSELGEITINPEEARFFDFDYMEGEQPIGHVSVSLAERNSMKVYFSHGITESMNDGQKNNWYGFLKELRLFAKRRLLNFDTRDIAKDNLDKRDYAFLSQYANPTPNTEIVLPQTVGESIMSESSMYGSKNMSYQKLEDTRLIIKHSKSVMDDTAPGARSRNISGLFVENAMGERFKYPFIHLEGARAMQRHVANGGVPYDEIGKSIIGMSEQIAQLKSFGNYVVRNDLMNSDTNSVVERSSAYLNTLREQIKALTKQKPYEAYRETFQAQPQMEVPQDVVEDFTNKFTVKNFKEDIASVFPVLYRLMQENNAVGYDDIVAMTTQEEIEENYDTVAADPFAAFEEWAMALGEESAISSSNPEEQQAAIKQLQELVGQHFPAGVDGSNAIESLKGIIEDPQLNQAIKAQAKQDSDSCTRGLVKDWLEQNAPEVVDELDFGDYVEEPQEATDTVEKDPEGKVKSWSHEGDWKKSAKKDPAVSGPGKVHHMSDVAQRKTAKMDVKELAEFIHSFYDKDSGTFPKGPEGVAIMVGKKFGEQAEQAARQMVERMAPQQSTEIDEGGEEKLQAMIGKEFYVKSHGGSGKVIGVAPNHRNSLVVALDNGNQTVVHFTELQQDKPNVMRRTMDKLSSITGGGDIPPRKPEPMGVVPTDVKDYKRLAGL
jgi:hypothetical protein